MSGPDLSAARDIGAARRALTAQLEAAGIESPALDARVLIGHALSLDHTALASSAARAMTAPERDRIVRLAARRIQGEPVARILGVKEFWGLSFALSRATLVPRPDTETVVEAALAAIGARKREALRIADLGTGTGAILLALLHELPDATGIGTDIDAGAIETARMNAHTLGFASRAGFTLADFESALNETFDLVVSNPPYIATRDIDALQREVREYDPRLALDGGPDGLGAYRTIARQASHLLRGTGHLVVEVGAGQDADVTAILSATGALEPVATHTDLSGVTRAVTVRRIERGGR